MEPVGILNACTTKVRMKRARMTATTTDSRYSAGHGLLEGRIVRRVRGWLHGWLHYSHSSTRSTARKASCGMSTWPTRFMRFLPSFCFSRSLRLREMSPP